MISYPAYDILRVDDTILDLTKVNYVRKGKDRERETYNVWFYFEADASIGWGNLFEKDATLIIDHYLAYLLTRNNQ